MTEEDIAVQAALAAAPLLRERPVGVRHKGAVDLVTEVDLAVERAVREVLARHTPEVPVLGEEGGGAEAARTRWVVDPLDGTTNFVHGFPFYCTSIALEVDGRPVVGVIHDPVRGRTFRGTAGRGATVDGAPLRVSDVRTLDAALCATGFPYDRRQRAGFYLRFVKLALERTQGVRRAGAAALDLAQLAAGQVDLYWEFNLGRWDVAAGWLLVEEAGGRVTPIPGYTLDGPACPMATNGWLHDQLAALIDEGLEES